jgi:hypothetical protein
MTAVSTHAYARAHTAAFVSDKMRNLLKILIRYHGLDPTALVDAWTSWVDRAARAWLGRTAAIVRLRWSETRTVLNRI